MSGHSHWAGIKHQKGRKDAQRSEIFSKLSQKITQAAASNQDPDTNAALRQAIEDAKKANLPKDRIERAINRAKQSASGGAIEIYEAIAPNGVGLLIKVNTDNKNRTLNELRQVLNKYHGQLGKSRWMFDDALKAKYPISLTDQQLASTQNLIADLKSNVDVIDVFSNLS